MMCGSPRISKIICSIKNINLFFYFYIFGGLYSKNPLLNNINIYIYIYIFPNQ